MLTEEEDLDPQDWEALRSLGHQMLDDMFSYLKSARSRPVWQPAPEAARASLHEALPVDAQPPEQVYEQYLQGVLPYQLGNTHPRFWGWVIGAGTPLGMLAEMLAAGANPNVWGGNQIACQVEAQVLDWLKEMLGYPAEAGGLLVSGCSMANLIGLAVARNARAGFDVRLQGLTAAVKPLCLYASAEAHSSLQKAVELLGLGGAALRKIRVNEAYQIDIAALKQAIAADLAHGNQPFCVIGCAGTVNTGACDNLEGLADICAQYDLWLHVDGAFGALAYLAPELRPMLQGMQRADSLAFDLHKWMNMPYEAGCILVRREADQRAAFSLTPHYLAHATRGLSAAAFTPSDYGPELSRGFRALKVWMSLKTYGVQKYARLVQQNVRQARYLSDLIQGTPGLELLAPTSLNIVCFRCHPPGIEGAALNQLNEELLIRLQESGLAAPSHTLLGGRFALRVAITNHRSRRQDFDLLVEALVRIVRELAPGSL